MSLLGLVPKISVPPIETRTIDEPMSAEQFVQRLRDRLQDMERGLTEEEQLEVVTFLPSGKAISVEKVEYENPALILLHGQEQETGNPCTLLGHQSTMQVLVSIEPIPAGETRKSVEFSL